MNIVNLSICSVLGNCTVNIVGENVHDTDVFRYTKNRHLTHQKWLIASCWIAAVLFLTFLISEVFAYQPEIKFGNFIDYDLQETSLEIRVATSIGSNELINLKLYNSEERDAGSVKITLSDPPQLKIGKCVDSIEPTADISAISDSLSVWKITKTEGPGLTIGVNDMELLQILLSDDVCQNYRSSWKNFWEKEVAKIKFLNSDTASSEYSSTSS